MGEENTILEGTLTSGLGKGAIFLSIDYYKEEIKEKLGFEPYPGTLNLTVDKEKTSLLTKFDPIRINSFKKDDKTYGGASCYKIQIKNIDAYIIIPDMTEHDDGMVEIIAPVNLKLELNVKDGDKIKIQLL